MKFVATEEIAAPIADVWTHVSDLEKFEARFAKNVRDLTRRPPGPIGVGTIWTSEATIIGRRRKVEVRLCELSQPTHLETLGETEGMVVTVRADLHAVAPAMTRLTVTAEMRARSLAARLLIQSIRLGRKSVAHRFKERVAHFSEAIEIGYSAGSTTPPP